MIHVTRAVVVCRYRSVCEHTGSSDQELRQRLAQLEAENAELRRQQQAQTPPPPALHCSSAGEVTSAGASPV